MERVTSELLALALSVWALAGCSKGFEPGTEEPPPPKTPATRIEVTPQGEPRGSSGGAVSKAALRKTMHGLNDHFVSIMTNLKDSSGLSSAAEEAGEIVKQVPQIRTASKDPRYQELVGVMQTRAEQVISSAVRGDRKATLKSAREMIRACEDCHAAYRSAGRLMGP